MDRLNEKGYVEDDYRIAYLREHISAMKTAEPMPEARKSLLPGIKK